MRHLFREDFEVFSLKSDSQLWWGKLPILGPQALLTTMLEVTSLGLKSSSFRCSKYFEYFSIVIWRKTVLFPPHTLMLRFLLLSFAIMYYRRLCFQLTFFGVNKKKKKRSFHCGSVEMNLSMRMQVPSLTSLSGLRIWCCLELWWSFQMQLRSHIAVA